MNRPSRERLDLIRGMFCLYYSHNEEMRDLFAEIDALSEHLKCSEYEFKKLADANEKAEQERDRLRAALDQIISLINNTMATGHLAKLWDDALEIDAKART